MRNHVSGRYKQREHGISLFIVINIGLFHCQCDKIQMRKQRLHSANMLGSFSSRCRSFSTVAPPCYQRMLHILSWCGCKSKDVRLNHCDRGQLMLAGRHSCHSCSQITVQSQTNLSVRWTRVHQAAAECPAIYSDCRSGEFVL